MTTQVATPAFTSTTVTDEVDQFNLALPQMDGSLTRSGLGHGHTTMTLHVFDELIMGRVALGFPMVGSADIHDDAVTVGVALSAPPESRWDGEEVSPGHVVLYPGGGHHQAVDPAGMEVGLLVIEQNAMERAIEDLGRKPTALKQGRLNETAARHIVDAYTTGIGTEDATGIIEAIALASSEQVAESIGRVHSKQIVRRAVDYVEETGDALPLSLSLCRATGVSERRLQLAFRDIYDTTPTRFFRKRALSMARARLSSPADLESPVTHVAFELGFKHLSRFSSYYRQQHGEYPSDTAQRTRTTTPR